MQELIDSVFWAFIRLLPIAIPIGLFPILWKLRLEYINKKFLAKQTFCLLEIKLPKEIMKTPSAMELVFVGLHQTSGESTWYDTHILGKTRTWFSLEIVSEEGNIRFFVWTRTAWKKNVENVFYAQYPGIEIIEVEDYTNGINYDPEKMEAWGCNYALTKPDPYPIKTYIDYKLDKTDVEEESKVDPMSQFLEFMGSLKKGEFMWFQFVIRAYKSKGDEWKKKAEEDIKKIIEGKKKDGTVLPVTQDEEDIIKSLKRSISKLPFETGIRAIYFTEKDSFDGITVPTMVSIMKLYNSNDLNGFKPTGGMTEIDFPWQDIGGRKSRKIKKEIFEAYKMRMFFFPPYRSQNMVLNVEEMATIYHFPGQVAQTPNLRRISSKKSAPPPNLPI